MASTSSLAGSKHSMQRRTSCSDTVCSSNSSCCLQKRKPTNPLAQSLRTYVPKSNSVNSSIKQRVYSAKMLRLRSLQNQLNDANYHLSELERENKTLRNLQSRQGKALSRYEGTNADLPKLLQSHEEEVRVLNARNKDFKKKMKELQELFRQKDEELSAAREQIKSLTILTKQKNLGERQALADQVQDLKDKLDESEEKASLLTRKLSLEIKNNRHHLNNEIAKNKQTQRDLMQALSDVNRLTGIGEMSKVRPSLIGARRRFAGVKGKDVQSSSLISLDSSVSSRCVVKDTKVSFNLESKSASDLSSRLEEAEEDGQSSEDQDEKPAKPQKKNAEPPATKDEIFRKQLMKRKQKLDKEIARLEAEQELAKKNASIKNSSESASQSSNEENDVEKFVKEMSMPLLKQKHSLNEFKEVLQGSDDTPALLKVNLSGEKEKGIVRFKVPLKNKKQNLPSPKSDSSDEAVDPAQRQQNMQKHLASVYTGVGNEVLDMHGKAHSHLTRYINHQSETEKLLSSLREADSFNAKLRHSTVLKTDQIDVPETDKDVANEVLNEERTFRTSMKRTRQKRSDHGKSDRNGNLINNMEEVTSDDKSMLLAALKAIDNGDDAESIQFTFNRKKTSV